MTWKDDWPIIGVPANGKEWGTPVPGWKKPDVGRNYPVAVPQTSDEFDSTYPGLQWQWHANHSDRWYSLTENPGSLRLRSVAVPDSCTNLWIVPNLLLQKFCAPRFTATTTISFSPESIGEKAGLLVMGIDYSYLGLIKRKDGLHLMKAACKDAEKGTEEREEADIPASGGVFYLRVHVDSGAVCTFSYSEDGSTYRKIGQEFRARRGKWIGAKIGVFSTCPAGSSRAGFSDYDWFWIE
jgi:beta-xylosidase